MRCPTTMGIKAAGALTDEQRVVLAFFGKNCIFFEKTYKKKAFFSCINVKWTYFNSFDFL